jgi:homoserine dehydrogenase
MHKQKNSPIRVGIAGVGTVGTAVVNILNDASSAFRQQLDTPIEISQVVVRNLETQRDCDLNGVTIGTDVMALSSAEDVDVVIELIGDVNISLSLVKQCLLNGKPVITANKALLALHGDELFALSKEKKLPILFEAAVGGGIPIIKVMRESLQGNRVDCIAGIINGTCNYLLTRMANEGAKYEDVLLDAQNLGYAEADPTFDVEGIDAAHKLSLLARLAFHQSIEFEEIQHFGLADVQIEDFIIAKKMGYAIKPMSVCKRTDDKIEGYVFPALVSNSLLLANVNGVTNAVQVCANRVGEINCVGPGAGGDATGSAVVADLVEVVYAMQEDNLSSVYFPDLGDSHNQAQMIAFEDTEHAYYFRFRVEDKPGMIKQFASVLEGLNISIEAINQDEPKEGEKVASIALITNKVQEKKIQKALKDILSLPGYVDEDWSLIRVFNRD